jgi:hypothetical protein
MISSLSQAGALNRLSVTSDWKIADNELSLRNRWRCVCSIQTTLDEDGVYFPLYFPHGPAFIFVSISCSMPFGWGSDGVMGESRPHASFSTNCSRPHAVIMTVQESAMLPIVD